MVDSRGARRRLQALQRIGWSLVELAELTGMRSDVLSKICAGKSDRTQPTVHRVIADVYDKLSATPSNGKQSRRISTAAKNRGYVAPLDWDDIDLDDAPFDGEAVELSEIDQYRELRYLGYSDWEIARRFGIELESLQRRFLRAA